MSLYLSRLLLDPRSRQVRSELASPYEMHRTLMHAFERFPLDQSRNARETFGVLFRAEAEPHVGRVLVYVQSNVEPDWSFLSHSPGYLLSQPGDANPTFKNVAAAYQKLRDGQVLAFRLRGNPTKRIGKDAEHSGALTGKRVGLLREDEQIAWLTRRGHEREKGRPGGFELLSAESTDVLGETRWVPRVAARSEGKQEGRKRAGGSPHTTTHMAVVFDGLLRVTDAEAFRETLARGIGSAKAYGFGLLSIANVGA